MPSYLILETEDGLTVVEAMEGETVEETALRHGGTVDADAQFYPTYEEACNALAAIPVDPTD